MKRTVHLILCLMLLIPFFGNSQDPAQYGTPFAAVPDTRDVNMYQVNIRPYSAAGNLAGVTARLDSIKKLGINVVYLMPVYPVGQDSRSSPSPYCIKDFKAVGAEFGSLTDLRNLVDGAHARNMAVILDWVVNQTSWDHPWITQHPDWYVRVNNVIQPLDPFPDVAALNFSSTAMRTEMINSMRYWVFAANIDGFRCDYANNPPLDFWTQCINNLRGITSHKLLMLAEGDRLENFNVGFDMNFGDKWYYDAIRRISQEGLTVGQIQTTTNTEYTYAGATQQVVRYTSNHDVMSTTTPLQVFGSHNGVVANFLVSAYLRGVPFLASGQEVDFNQVIPWPYTSVDINWSANNGASVDFARILNFRTASNAIRRGTMNNYSNTNVCAFTKIAGTEKVVVMTNLRNSTSTFVIPSGLAGSYNNALGSGTVTLTTGATQTLAPYQYIVLTNANVPVVPVTGVAVSPTSVSFSVGVTQQLTATIAPSNATNQAVTWTSGNTAVATVSASGLVTGVATGTAVITAKTQDGNKTATANVTITAASTFTVNFFKPSAWGTGIRIYWWSAQPAGVLADGTWPGVLMTNNGNGWYSYTFTNITSTNLIFNDGSSQSADLNRGTTGWYLNGAWYNTNPGTPILVTGVTVSPTSATVNIGATQQLTASVAPANATTKTVTWSSGNTGVATVSSTGLVTGIASGVATITVTTTDGNKTATSAVTVPSAGGGTFYTIRNRWTNAYLYDGGANVNYGATVANNNYKWEKVPSDGGFFYLRNLGTGEYMQIENQTGSVQCTAVTLSWWSAQWSQDNVDATWVRFRNRWQTGSIIHVENQTGSAQYANAQDGWYSAQWQLTLASAGRSVSDETITPDKNPSMMIFPNPAPGGAVTVRMSGLRIGETYTLSIIDMQGRTVGVRKITSNLVNRFQLRPGTYLVKVIGGETSISKKLMVQ